MIENCQIFLMNYLYQPFKYSSTDTPLMEALIVPTAHYQYHHNQIPLFLWLFGNLKTVTELFWFSNIYVGYVQLSNFQWSIHIQGQGISHQPQVTMDKVISSSMSWKQLPIFWHFKVLVSIHLCYVNKTVIHHCMVFRAGVLCI